MKNLFFVAVITFSGTVLSSNAQTSVHEVKFVAPLKEAVKFIDNIEIKQPAANSLDVVYSIAPLKKIHSKTAISGIEGCFPLQFKYAQLLDTYVETIANIKLYQVIDEWWATRYIYGGTSKNGIDCSAFTSVILKEAFDITLPRTAQEQYNASVKINIENLVEGDLVFFNTRGGVSHVGVYLCNGYFVHSSSHKGVTISSLNESYYSHKFIGGGRVNN